MIIIFPGTNWSMRDWLAKGGRARPRAPRLTRTGPFKWTNCIVMISCPKAIIRCSLSIPLPMISNIKRFSPALVCFQFLCFWFFSSLSQSIPTHTWSHTHIHTPQPLRPPTPNQNKKKIQKTEAKTREKKYPKINALALIGFRVFVCRDFCFVHSSVRAWTRCSVDCVFGQHFLFCWAIFKMKRINLTTMPKPWKRTDIIPCND